MSLFNSPRFLSFIMLADAAVSLPTGIAQLAATRTLSEGLNLPPGLLSATGWFFVVYSAVVAFIGTRSPVPRTLVGLISIGNFGWAALCTLALLGPWLSPSALGIAWILAQALVVTVLAELQWLGLRRSSAGLVGV